MTDTRSVPVLALLTAALLCFLAVCAARPAEATSYGDLVIKVEQDADCSSFHGYKEHRLRVWNQSKKTSHRVRLRFTGQGYTGGRIHTIERTAEVGPASAILVTLPQPPLSLGSVDQVTVYIDGRRQKQLLPMSFKSHGYGRAWESREGRCVLIGKNVGGNLRQFLENRFAEGMEFARADLPVSDWSTSWLGYSRYDGVVLTAEELIQMPSSAREALLRSIEAGGTLLVLGTWQIPEPWGRWREEISGGSRVSMGFGSCVVVDSPSSDSLSQTVIREFRSSVGRTANPWRRQRGIAQANRMFRIVEDLRIPVRGLFLLVLVFAVTIGPVNLIVLSRMKRRIWMLWTIPVVSLLASTMVFGYALVAEGWTSERRSQLLTILDEVSHRTTSVGWTAYYSPMTPGGGLHFGYDTELTPQIKQDFGDSRVRTLDWTRDQHLVSGWVAARVPAHFLVRKSERRRERLSVQNLDGGPPEVVNGLGTTVRKLWLADHNGDIWYGENIGPGARSRLVPNPGARHAMAPNDALPKIYRTTWLDELSAMTNSPDAYLKPMTYLGVMDQTPFIEEGLEGSRPKQMKNIIYGILPESENAD